MKKKKLAKRVAALEGQMAALLELAGREQQYAEWKATSGTVSGDFGFGNWWQSEEATGPKELI